MADREGSEGSVAMEEDQDDDLYGANGARRNGQQVADANIQDGEEDDEEEEDSDDDIKIVTEREEPAVEIAAAPTRFPTVESKSQSTPVAAQARDSRPSVSAQAKPDTQPSRSTATTTLKPGTSYPQVRTSTVDVDNIPEYTLPDGTKKPITEIEIDADLAEHLKPWRRPGTDMTDYFNYGFDEFTWSMYTQKQRAMAGSLKDIKDQDEQFKMLMTGGFPGMPGMPPIPGMPGANSNGQGGGGGPQGMPAPDQMMDMMNQMMMQQGTSDPNQLDFGAFMQQMQGGGGGGGPPVGPAGGGQNYGGGQNWQGGGGRGRGGRRW